LEVSGFLCIFAANMQTIYQIIKPFDRLLGKQKAKKDKKYRLMNFVVKQPVEEGILLFNTMTKAMVLLSTEEKMLLESNPRALPSLIEDWYLVPEDFDDRLLSRQMRRVGQMLAKPKKDITTYTIFTTTDCNARCFYCFQKGCAKLTMDSSMAQKTADYMIKHCGGKKVMIHWFGGEPLYNKPVITLINQHLKDAGIEYKSTILTNGFLIDDATIQEMKERWNLKNVQISLDGTEKVYNRIKAYIYKDVNAFQQVMVNIHRLLDAGIKVHIRLNVDMYNVDDLYQLVEYFHYEFERADHLVVYLHTLFGEVVKQVAIHDDEKRKVLYAKIAAINANLETYGFLSKPRLKRKFDINHCMADDDESITILPDGHIGKCDNFADREFVGHIDQEEFSVEGVNSFKEVINDAYDACSICALYPICFRPRKCMSAQNCFEEERHENLTNIKRGMLSSLEKFKKKELNEDDEIQD